MQTDKKTKHRESAPPHWSSFSSNKDELAIGGKQLTNKERGRQKKSTLKKRQIITIDTQGKRETDKEQIDRETTHRETALLTGALVILTRTNCLYERSN